MSKLNGTKMKVVAGGTTIGGTKTFTLDIKRNNPDASDKESGGMTNRIAGKGDWSVKFDGLYDPAGVLNFEQLFDIIMAGTRVYLEMATIDGTGGGKLYKGYAYISDEGLVATAEEPITYSGTFEADGLISKGTVAAS
jgi:predicted secreted protein